MLKVYHGSPHIVESPLCHIGRDNLDFGNGFYVTGIKMQAISWATRVVNIGLPQWLNIYDIDLDQLKQDARCKIFTAYDEEWLNFIIDSRSGKKPWKNFDYIEGGIADDRIITTIEDYLNGDISMEYALKRQSEHQPNNQICLLSQELIDKYLHYIAAEPLNDLAKKEGQTC